MYSYAFEAPDQAPSSSSSSSSSSSCSSASSSYASHESKWESTSKKDKKVKKEDKKASRNKKEIEEMNTEVKKKRGRPRINVGIGNVPQAHELQFFDLINFNPSARAIYERPVDFNNHDDDDQITVGTYTKAVRRSKLERFKAKKLRLLLYGPYVRYQFRKDFAESRPRVGGRFVKMDSELPPLETPELSQQDWLDGVLADPEPFRVATPPPPYGSVLGDPPYVSVVHDRTYASMLPAYVSVVGDPAFVSVVG